MLVLVVIVEILSFQSFSPAHISMRHCSSSPAAARKGEHSLRALDPSSDYRQETDMSFLEH